MQSPDRSGQPHQHRRELHRKLLRGRHGGGRIPPRLAARSARRVAHHQHRSQRTQLFRFCQKWKWRDGAVEEIASYPRHHAFIPRWFRPWVRHFAHGDGCASQPRVGGGIDSVTSCAEFSLCCLSAPPYCILAWCDLFCAGNFFLLSIMV